MRAAVIVIAWPSAARSAASAVLDTPRNGIVTSYSAGQLEVAGSALPVIGPSYGGSDAALLIITTASAPAIWPHTARVTRAHVPRSVTAICSGASGSSEMPASVYSWTSQPRPGSTTISYGPGGRAAPLALIAVRT